MSLPQALEEALFDSLSTGTFVDVKFYAFSQRTMSGRVRYPKPLYANSHILQTVPYFRSLLSNGFSEGKLTDLRGSFPSDQPTELDGHDFLDDSDLEEIEDNTKLTISIPETTPEHRTSPFKSPAFGSGFSSPFLPQIAGLGSVGAMTSSRAALDPSTYLGKVVVLRDISFVTLRAVLFFLYTGEIAFTSAPNSTNAKKFNVSAKSVYQAADKYDIPELKELALKWIQSTIHSRDIMRELASDFTTVFPEIREICLQQLANALCSGARVNTSKNLMSTIRASIHGDYEPTIDPETRGAIFDMLAKGYTPTRRVPYVTPASSRPPNWSYLREALRKSLVSGGFLDGHIKAYRGKCKGEKLTRPSSIYFSTASIPPITMDKMRHELTDRPSSEHKYDSDSDLEDDDGEPSKGSRLRDAGSFGKVNFQHAAIMRHGSWNTWRAALFFMYSRKVAFAPIRSQMIVQSGVSELPSVCLCSPKSAFVLAEKIGIQHLQDRARDDLLQKVTKENLMTEYFSKFVNSHTPLLLIINNIVRKTRNAGTDAMVRKVLVEPPVDSPHIFAALELFFQNVIEENDRRIVGLCSSCCAGYTIFRQPKDGRCHICVNERRVRPW